MIGIILVKDFCPVKIKITQFCNGFDLNQFPINVEQIVNIMCMTQILWFLIFFLALQVITVNYLYSGHSWDIELVSSLAIVYNNRSFFQSNGHNKFFCHGFSCCPYYQGVHCREVSAR